MCSDTADILFRVAEHAWGFHMAAETSPTTAHAGTVQHGCSKGSWTIVKRQPTDTTSSMDCQLS